MPKLRMMNAAGTAKTIEQIRKLARCEPLTEVTIGSITYEPREGNTGNTFYAEPGVGSLNSLGLPNRGRKYLMEVMPELLDIVEHTADKRLRVSIAGSNAQEITALARAARGASTVEVNLGCPNVWDGGRQKEIWAFNPDRIDEAAHAAKDAVGSDAFVALKLSPLTDPEQFNRVIGVLERLVKDETISDVVYSNAIPNSFLWALDTATPAITPGGGLAGGAGKGILPFVIGGLRQLRQRLGREVEIIGVGGICDGWSLAQHIMTGVDAVQINSAYYESENPGVFSEILTDFAIRCPQLVQNYS